MSYLWPIRRFWSSRTTLIFRTLALRLSLPKPSSEVSQKSFHFTLLYSLCSCWGGSLSNKSDWNKMRTNEIIESRYTETFEHWTWQRHITKKTLHCNQILMKIKTNNSNSHRVWRLDYRKISKFCIKMEWKKLRVIDISFQRVLIGQPIIYLDNLFWPLKFLLGEHFSF